MLPKSREIEVNSVEDCSARVFELIVRVKSDTLGNGSGSRKMRDGCLWSKATTSESN